LEHRIGVLSQRLGEWQRSQSHFRAAEAQFTYEEPGSLARLLADWSLSAHRLGERDRAVSLAERASALARAASDERALAQTWNILGVLARSRGDRDEATRCLEESKALSTRIGDRDTRAAALNNLALLQAAQRDWQPALALAREALADSVATGDRHREAAILNNLADFHHALGQESDAMVALTRSVAIYAEIGTVEGEMQSEIWKLVEW
jgi:tetratricopeptide (TPR) repeat protein